MKKNDVIQEVKAQTTNRIAGFQVLSIDETDIEEYAGRKLKARFKKLDDTQKREFLSLLMDEIYDTFEQSPNFGFKSLFDETLEAIDIDELLEQAENAKEEKEARKFVLTVKKSDDCTMRIYDTLKEAVEAVVDSEFEGMLDEQDVRTAETIRKKLKDDGQWKNGKGTAYELHEALA